jgi:hypothetical protein
MVVAASYDFITRQGRWPALDHLTTERECRQPGESARELGPARSDTRRRPSPEVSRARRSAARPALRQQPVRPLACRADARHWARWVEPDGSGPQT